MSIAEEIKKALDNKELSYCVSIDFQNTFDTVNHDILTTKFQYSPWYQRSNSKFVSVLLRQQSDRVQQALVNDLISEVALITFEASWISIISYIYERPHESHTRQNYVPRTF